MFASVLVLLRLRLHLGLAMIAGSVLLAIFFAVPWPAYLQAVWLGLFSAQTIFLAILVGGILILSSAMDASGQMKRIVDRFRDLVGESRITLVAFPAMIGMLPMPGGAVFSAPMVGAVSENSALSPTRKSILNYWFRHIWEYWFPLYPGVILAIVLSRVEPGQFIALELPMTLVALSAGYLLILRSTQLPGKRALNLSPRNVRRFLYEMIPILLMVLCMLLLGPVAKRLASSWQSDSEILKRSPILIGLVTSTAWVVFTGKMQGGTFLRLFTKKGVWGMVLLILGLMVFKQVLESGGVVVSLKEELLAYHIPLVVLVALLPFIAGVVTGIAVGFVGVSFPVVLSLLEGSGLSGFQLLPYVFLGYSWGYAGMMLSPVHLCLLLTRDYFKAELFRIYKRYLIPLNAVALLASVVLFRIYISF